MLRRARRHSIPGDDRGVTLAEILVATAVISIGLVGLAMVIPLSTYGVHEGNALSTATFLAEQRLEEVRNASWTTVPAANDCLGLGSGTAPTSTTCGRTQPTACTAGTTCTTYPDEASVAGKPGYSRTVRVIDCGTGAGCAGVVSNDMRLVRVTVTYAPMSGVGGPSGTRSAVLEMIVARRQ
jgi:prepilin-type N-terminal cleavage/methylation domain-containing protein